MLVLISKAPQNNDLYFSTKMRSLKIKKNLL